MATFNIHHGVGTDGRLDLRRTSATLAATGAEVIGLQEVDRHWSARSGFVDQAAALAAELGMHMAFGATLDRPPADRGGPRRRYGNAILSRSPVGDVSWTLLPGRGRAEPRGLLVAVVAADDGPVTVGCTHLEPRSGSLRRAQARAVVDHLDDQRPPILLLGDLNAGPSAPEVQLLGTRLDDAWTVVGNGPGPTHPARRPRRRIDYVMASTGIEPRHAEVVATDASDHRPVVVACGVRSG